MRRNFGKIKDEALKKRMRRKLSIRKRVEGTEVRPRICAVKTNKHLSVQIIDDNAGKTLFSCQTFGKSAVEGASKTVEGAKLLGVNVATEMKKRGLTAAVFDRNGRSYMGIIAALATSIRENGIKVQPEVFMSEEKIQKDEIVENTTLLDIIM